ncbi:cyanophycinase [Bacillota bacterium LX-D]|nr:cyanophycinase [Bacillota bacterium LX-D]
MEEKVQGTLVIIGGAEDKKGKQEILKKFIDLSGNEDARLVVMTAATEEPETVGENYRRIFKDLGVKDIAVLNINSRQEANEQYYADTIKSSTGIFFTGGDQLRITSLLGGTSTYWALIDAYQQGIVIAGTSAGASVMSETMIVEGDSEEAPKKNTLKMAPGMGFIKGVVVDQHFAQRGRIGRLLSAVAQNPDILGIGIDEDTAIVVNSDAKFEVYGSQTVTIVDGWLVNHSNVSESSPSEALALTNITLHVLPAGYSFDLNHRVPIS